MRTRRITFLLLPLLLASCTIVSVDSGDRPARIESEGLITGHAAVGISDESHVLHASLFDGRSRGALAELVVWKLFRVEVGLAGASLGIGPLHLGLGVLAYEPRVPTTISRERKDDEPEGEVVEASAGR